MVVNDRILFFIIVVGYCDLFWNIAFVRFRSEMPPSHGFVLRHRRCAILL
jgi:hypothetical protein